ncbi:MAG: hypothetical protein M3N82_02150 [Pseudomonadota bacterium]|nr:hypothetical protein [Pseudomonadota bacterium]
MALNAANGKRITHRWPALASVGYTPNAFPGRFVRELPPGSGRTKPSGCIAQKPAITVGVLASVDRCTSATLGDPLGSDQAKVPGSSARF